MTSTNQADAMAVKLDDLEIAQREYERGRYRLCTQFADYWLVKNPDDGRALELIGLAAIKLGWTERGIAALEEAALISPLAMESRISLALAYGQIGRRQLSKDLLMLAATGGEIDDEALLSVAAGLEAIDEHVLAMEACRQAGLRCPENAEVHYQMGYYASRCDYPVHLVESLIRHAIGLDPDNVHYRIGLVSLLVRLGRKYEALLIVDPFIPERLDEITCECCMKRIANLFFDCDHFELAKLCAERHAELTQKNPSHHQSKKRENASWE